MSNRNSEDNAQSRMKFPQVIDGDTLHPTPYTPHPS